jgi:uronate dehydrogenase
MNIKTHHRILLTGAAGGLGRELRARLKNNCDILRLSDVKDLGGRQPQEEIMLGDLADAAFVQAMVENVDAIVHMGGISVEGAFGPILQSNILGLYNLYEASRIAGVKRIVFASSNHVTGFYKQSEIITPAHAARPDGLYGVSKAFGEDLSRFYFDRHGVETACLRIGSSFSKPKDKRMLATWLSFNDLHRLILACLSADELGHSIIYGLSRNSLSWWDNKCAKHIKFDPQDSADCFADEILAATTQGDPSDSSAQYQGGIYVTMGPHGFN